MGELREEPANANMIGMFLVGVLASRDAAFLCPSGLYYCVGYSGLMAIVKPQSLTIMAIDIINTAIICTTKTAKQSAQFEEAIWLI